jgi:uncharacterized protein (TIGR03382 family)
MMRVEFEVALATLQAVGLGFAGVLAVLLAVIVRRRRKRGRLRAAMTGISSDFVPKGEHGAIEEIRREMDASQRAYELRLVEEEWRRDGCILLEKRKSA